MPVSPCSPWHSKPDGQRAQCRRSHAGRRGAKKRDRVQNAKQANERPKSPVSFTVFGSSRSEIKCNSHRKQHILHGNRQRHGLPHPQAEFCTAGIDRHVGPVRDKIQNPVGRDHGSHEQRALALPKKFSAMLFSRQTPFQNGRGTNGPPSGARVARRLYPGRGSGVRCDSIRIRFCSGVSTAQVGGKGVIQFFQSDLWE